MALYALCVCLSGMILLVALLPVLLLDLAMRATRYVVHVIRDLMR